METQLIDPAAGKAPLLTLESGAADATAGRIERYLLAAGIAEPCRRERIARTVLRQLHLSTGEAAAWPEIIAAAETALLAELPAATPQRSHRPMEAQDLTPWKPHAGLLLPAPLSRSLRNLTACLGWLATVIIP